MESSAVHLNNFVVIWARIISSSFLFSVAGRTLFDRLELSSCNILGSF